MSRLLRAWQGNVGDVIYIETAQFCLCSAGKTKPRSFSQNNLKDVAPTASQQRHIEI